MLVTKVPSMILEVNNLHTPVNEAAAHREHTALPKVMNVKKQLSEKLIDDVTQSANSITSQHEEKEEEVIRASKLISQACD